MSLTKMDYCVLQCYGAVERMGTIGVITRTTASLRGIKNSRGGRRSFRKKTAEEARGRTSNSLEDRSTWKETHVEAN